MESNRKRRSCLAAAGPCGADYSFVCSSRNFIGLGTWWMHAKNQGTKWGPSASPSEQQGPYGQNMWKTGGGSTALYTLQTHTHIYTHAFPFIFFFLVLTTITATPFTTSPFCNMKDVWPRAWQGHTGGVSWKGKGLLNSGNKMYIHGDLFSREIPRVSVISTAKREVVLAGIHSLSTTRFVIAKCRKICALCGLRYFPRLLAHVV